MQVERDNGVLLQYSDRSILFEMKFPSYLPVAFIAFEGITSFVGGLFSLSF